MFARNGSAVVQKFSRLPQIPSLDLMHTAVVSKSIVDSQKREQPSELGDQPTSSTRNTGKVPPTADMTITCDQAQDELCRYFECCSWVDRRARMVVRAFGSRLSICSRQPYASDPDSESGGGAKTFVRRRSHFAQTSTHPTTPSVGATSTDARAAAGGG